MNAVLSIVAALVMAFNMGGGIMADLESPVSFEAKATLNTETVASLIPDMGDQAQMVQLAADIVNNVGFRATADKQTAELAMTAGEDMILSMGIRQAEDGITAASSLTEGLTLNLSAETLQALLDQMSGEESMNQLNELIAVVKDMDREEIVKALLTSMDHGVEAVKEKAGETESGTFAVDDFEFTTKTAVDMNDKEIATVIVNMMKEYLSQEYFQKLYALAGEDSNPLKELDEALKDIQNRPEDEALETTVFLYSNEDGEEYVSADLSQAGENGETEVSAHIGFGVEFKYHRLFVQYTQGETAPSYILCSIKDAENHNLVFDVTDPTSGTEVFINTTKSEGYPISGVVGARVSGMFIRAIIDTEYTGERTSCHARILCTAEGENIEEAEDLELATIDASWGRGGEITSVFDGDSVKAIAVEPLIQGEGESEMAELTASAMGGAMKALSVLIAHLPAESGAMINSLLSGGMSTVTTGD